MNLTAEQREQVATELKRFAGDLNLNDQQKEKLHSALAEGREKIGEYLKNLLYSFGTSIGPHASSLIFDGVVNLYGTTYNGGHGQGSVFKLTPSLGEWIYTSLHDFCSSSGCSDGAYPTGDIVTDANGNLYGTTTSGGQTGDGVLWKITPRL